MTAEVLHVVSVLDKALAQTVRHLPVFDRKDNIAVEDFFEERSVLNVSVDLKVAEELRCGLQC